MVFNEAARTQHTNHHAPPPRSATTLGPRGGLAAVATGLSVIDSAGCGLTPPRGEGSTGSVVATDL
ncbi:hypothetical protein DFR75_105327 [Nocardia ignorata]|uniref:Uncharacterized protein n=1 Tax=Nocardia ignorata TaxID=145285 RepID=A0A4R6PA77_NOCIG|nr:hypothetical protein DFR75_105327 [Nocardia ignorata]